MWKTAFKKFYFVHSWMLGLMWDQLQFVNLSFGYRLVFGIQL